ncbi:50S ribosomal protein L7/L12 [Frankliniella fusca]|uniref:50S ribosomal protein L7/L12 n=1 Tax=Frankliniella fusca TaxID=407009 RepID=A0AAE1LIH2_9NEOP|nr:50S ribosomal protein L7/L12 [Frankliniella fusca]
MTHRIKECNSKRPSAETIEPLIESFVVKALNEIALEHGDEKKQFVSEVLEISQCGVSEWNDFVSNILYPILQSVCKPTKMLPANQYEEQLISLNKLLNNEEVFSSFLAQLMSLNATSSNQNLGKMILFRLLTKLVDETLHFVFSEMRVSRLEQQDNNSTL